MECRWREFRTALSDGQMDRISGQRQQPWSTNAVYSIGSIAFLWLSRSSAYRCAHSNLNTLSDLRSTHWGELSHVNIRKKLASRFHD